MSSEPPKKKRKLPALDASFDEAPRRSDSPELHQGRKRAVPHQRGLWAAHVYLELEPSPGLSKILKRATADAEAAAPEGATPNASTDSALHLSLSRPLMLQTNQRADLRAAVARVAGSCAGFSARYASFAVLENDDKSRRFLGVEIGQGYDALLGLVRKLDGELATLRLPMYYPSPRFHTSLAWTTSTTASSPSPPFSDALLEDLEQRLGKKLRLEGEVFAAEVCVKVGKDVTRYRLAGAAAARDGL
ncbi:poly(U)-specific 3'-to-5' RNA exonuclease [Rhodotorula kratochvilovae]